MGAYKYCGHAFILGNRDNDWQDANYVLGYFNKKKKIARSQYREYVFAGIEMGRHPDLVGGGLIRSLGGWSEDLELGKDDKRLKGDERILGDSQFVLDTLQEAEESIERRYELKAFGYDLKALGQGVESIFELKPGDGYSSGKYPRLIKPRSVFCYWAVRELGENATSIAKILGLPQWGVSKLVLRGETIVKYMHLKLIEK